MAFHCSMTPGAGGGITYYHALKAGLARQGWEVLAVAAGAEAARGYDHGLADAGCYLLAPTTDSIPDAIDSLCAWLQEHRVDVYHAGGMGDIGTLALPHIPAGIRTLVSVHDNPRRALRIATAHHHHVDQYVCVNPVQHEGLRRLVPQRTQVAFIAHGVTCPEERPAPRPASPDVLELGYLGRVSRGKKGADLIVPIAQLLVEAEVRFRWRVAGTGSYVTELRQKVCHAGMESHFALLGQLSPRKVSTFLASTDVFLFPSLFEAFGYSLAEAMAHGCAVVASRLRGVTDMLIEDGDSGLLADPGNAADFAAKVQQLASHPELLARLGRNAAERIATHFSVAAMGEGYANVLAAMQQRPSQRAAPVPLARFRIPRTFQPTWRRHIPPVWKEWLRARTARWGWNL